MDLIKKIIMSSLSGTSVTLIYLLTSHSLDKIMNAKYSNIISLIISASINFILQSYTFLHKNLKNNIKKIIPKYLIAEIIILSLSQIGVIYFLDNKQKITKLLPDKLKKYYNSIIRLFVISLVFFIVSFPLRKMWVFI